MSDIDDRETPYRFPHDSGKHSTRWLTKKELEMANIIGVDWYPTQHGDSYPIIVCPTPHICGWFCSVKDENRIRRAMEYLNVKQPKQIVSRITKYADGSEERENY